jgi:hypothetical protein
MPALISSRLGAVLSGRSYKAFCRDLRPQCVDAETGKIDLARLESVLGVGFEAAALWHAERRLDRTRDREMKAKRKERLAA